MYIEWNWVLYILVKKMNKKKDFVDLMFILE